MNTHQISTLDFFLIKQQTEFNNVVNFIGISCLHAENNKLIENIYNFTLISFLVIGYPFSSVWEFFILNKYSRCKIEYNLKLLNEKDRLFYWKKLKENFLKEILDMQLFYNRERVELTFQYINDKYFRETLNNDQVVNVSLTSDTTQFENIITSNEIKTNKPVEIEYFDECKRKNSYEKYYSELGFIYGSDSNEFESILNTINELHIFRHEITKNILIKIVSGTLSNELIIGNQRVFCAFFEFLERKNIVHSCWQSFFANQKFILSKKGERLTQAGLSTAATYKNTSKIRKQTIPILDNLELTLNNFKN